MNYELMSVFQQNSAMKFYWSSKLTAAEEGFLMENLGYFVIRYNTNNKYDTNEKLLSAIKYFEKEIKKV